MNDLCYVMANESLGEPLDRLAHLSNITELFGVEVNFTSTLESLANTTWEGGMAGQLLQVFDVINYSLSINLVLSLCVVRIMLPMPCTLPFCKFLIWHLCTCLWAGCM